MSSHGPLASFEEGSSPPESTIGQKTPNGQTRVSRGLTDLPVELLLAITARSNHSEVLALSSTSRFNRSLFESGLFAKVTVPPTYHNGGATALASSLPAVQLASNLQLNTFDDCKYIDIAMSACKTLTITAPLAGTASIFRKGESNYRSEVVDFANQLRSCKLFTITDEGLWGDQCHRTGSLLTLMPWVSSVSLTIKSSKPNLSRDCLHPIGGLLYTMKSSRDGGKLLQLDFSWDVQHTASYFYSLFEHARSTWTIGDHRRCHPTFYNVPETFAPRTVQGVAAGEEVTESRTAGGGSRRAPYGTKKSSKPTHTAHHNVTCFTFNFGPRPNDSDLIQSQQGSGSADQDPDEISLQLDEAVSDQMAFLEMWKEHPKQSSLDIEMMFSSHRAL
ncbi:hypothetical protein BCR39DRAFT_518127 [Naematelia encephala]|uniref:F-box domain-containing protein n=1 Tax=Naematelia encephala TaxID=71784 RepID=A0A1Y2BGV1_9TREE|nr:hypothetical protein BCR39DRAFT_518127 [Naematelia encephala]